MARRAERVEEGRLQVNRNRNEACESFIKTPIEPRKPDTKFRKAETEAEASLKIFLRSRSRSRIHKTTFEEAEAETEASNF